jgi:bacterioferritin
MATAQKNGSRQRAMADARAAAAGLPPVVTEEYQADVATVIRRLNELRSTELCSYLQYKHHAYMAVSLMGPAVREEFLEHADEELRHADMLAERVQQLGGVPIFDPAEIAEKAARVHVTVSQGTTLEQMVREDLELERKQVNAYMRFIREVGFSDPTTRRILEEILKDTEHHANEMRDMLISQADTK